ncbi:ABC transporter ATP-binding protein [Candidatus Galacturonibacter soehngenii]|uniref:ABC transporter ATP-binding protein n=1 Tax=Candidatus Galacturonatibacter soehngenii TaxID=2307010 RepID=A0A7V7QN84_9FIRM|nr:ABC transporter ATP-binding protein [Candidatus Galacturonibacter soehngenii]KAB1439863.1 ABC transporter ATP-binding protein [Candidatus Galacturonibacter soehngenii]MBA4685902.1 ABC transporter ATP-binding protein [Candidatus Galacturonibacter soehngenii]
MLEIKNLTKSYGDFKAVDDFTLSVKEGDIYGFVGPNGAGKTTIMKILSGLLPADAGTITIDNENILKDITRLKKTIGYMPDFFGVYDNLTVIEYLLFYSAAYGISDDVARERAKELLELVDLQEKVNEYVDSLSRGMKQRLCLARTLVHNPDILILDEPASGLDPYTRHQLKSILRHLSETGKTIIISSHILTELAELCSSICIIEKGRVIMNGNIEEIMFQVDSSNPLLVHVLDNVNKAVLILKKNKYVRTLSVEENKIMVTFIGRKEDEANLLKELIESGVLVISFKREQSNLESLFLKIIEKGSEF